MQHPVYAKIFTNITTKYFTKNKTRNKNNNAFSLAKITVLYRELFLLPCLVTRVDVQIHTRAPMGRGRKKQNPSEVSQTTGNIKVLKWLYTLFSSAIEDLHLLSFWIFRTIDTAIRTKLFVTRV
jgi:hypothetical protein